MALAPRPANDPRSYEESDIFLWCDCGCGKYWIRKNPETGWYHVICMRCEQDMTMTIVGE